MILYIDYFKLEPLAIWASSSSAIYNLYHLHQQCEYFSNQFANILVHSPRDSLLFSIIIIIIT